MAHLIEELVVGTTTLKVKFLRSVKVSTIANERFLLYQNTATPVPVTDPFKPIAVSTAYEGIARILTLFFSTNLSPGAPYRLTVTGLKDAAGVTIADETVDFNGPAVTTVDPLPPEELPILIEDFSIKALGFDEFVPPQETGVNPEFYVVATDPPADDPVVATTHANGRVTVKFSARPQSTFVNTAHFKAQRKPIQRAFSRWETVGVLVTSDMSKPWVYVDFPSTDATPVYNTAGKEYFPLDWKYRVRVSEDVDVAEVSAPTVGRELNLTILQGATFTRNLTLVRADGTPTDLTGYTGTMQIRATNTSPVLLELTTENGGVIIDPLLGKVTILLSPVQTSTFDITTGLYEVEITSSDATPVVIRVLSGTVTIVPGFPETDGDVIEGGGP